MEGLKKPFRAIKENPGKTTIVLASYMAAQTRLTTYNLSYPEYMNIPKEDRWGSIIVMLPSKEKDVTGRWKPNYYNLFPATREWSIFLGLTTFAMEKAFTDSPETVETFFRSTAGNVTPFFDIPAPVTRCGNSFKRN